MHQIKQLFLLYSRPTFNRVLKYEVQGIRKKSCLKWCWWIHYGVRISSTEMKTDWIHLCLKWVFPSSKHVQIHIPCARNNLEDKNMKCLARCNTLAIYYHNLSRRQSSALVLYEEIFFSKPANTFNLVLYISKSRERYGGATNSTDFVSDLVCIGSSGPM